MNKSPTLFSVGKIEQLDDDVRRTAKFNNSTYPAEIFENKNEIEANKELFAGKATLFDLFRPMTICIRTIVMFYNWLVIIISLSAN